MYRPVTEIVATVYAEQQVDVKSRLVQYFGHARGGHHESAVEQAGGLQWAIKDVGKHLSARQMPTLRQWLSRISAGRGSRIATREAARAHVVIRVGEIR